MLYSLDLHVNLYLHLLSKTLNFIKTSISAYTDRNNEYMSTYIASIYM